MSAPPPPPPPMPDSDPEPRRGGRASVSTGLAWARRHLFSTPFNAALTLLLAYLGYRFASGIVHWALIDAVWHAETGAACRAAAGACWAVIAEKHRPMLFGVYPYEEHWRLALAVLVYLAAVAATAVPAFWRLRILAPIWLATVVATSVLLWGGVAGLRPVETNQWGGLPLTLVLFSGTMVIGFPVAVALALGRRSHLPAVRVSAASFIECMRGVPLITILFVAVNVFPLFLPQHLELNKLLRVMVGLAVFSACYQAEVIRGGLQAIPRGQYEAAEALGLGYWRTMGLIVLPQALRICLPGIVNHVIAAFKNTSFVIIIGLFDVLTATSAVLSDPLWRQFYVEAYLFVAAVYFAFCFVLSKYSQWLEARLAFGSRQGGGGRA